MLFDGVAAVVAAIEVDTPAAFDGVVETTAAVLKAAADLWIV